MHQDKAAALLGMATKAGKTVSGEDTVLHTIQSRKAYAVIVSVEASDRTKKTFKDKCSFYKVPYFEKWSREELGRCTGKPERTVAAVADKGFGEEIVLLFREEI